MTNWHTLPLEIKSLILSAHIDCVVQDESFICFKDSLGITVYHNQPSSATTKKNSITRWPLQSDLLALLLVAPELKPEAIRLVKWKPSATFVVNRCLVLVQVLEGDAREWCILSMMKLYYSRPDVVIRVPRSRGHHDTWICQNVDIDIVNEQIMDAQAKRQQLVQKK